MNYRAMIEDRIRWSIEVKRNILENSDLMESVLNTAGLCLNCYRNKGKLLFCGNGGSAADAQHIAAELSGRFLMDRPPLYAEALHGNASFMTAVANDYSYEMVFSRMIRAMGSSGDVLFAISTSGNSKNIIEAAIAAKESGMKIVGMTGKDGGMLANLVDLELRIPSDDTARIQECHILLGHILCEIIEKEMFGH